MHVRAVDVGVGGALVVGAALLDDGAVEAKVVVGGAGGFGGVLLGDR